MRIVERITSISVKEFGRVVSVCSGIEVGVGRRLRFLAGPRNDSEKGLGMRGGKGLVRMEKGGFG